ncbi:hypothetical protein IFR05_007818 [Cadophora sp. M221]|nr:hypothetical protein IFR05_007818 [Cadophora sp. M221]
MRCRNLFPALSLFFTIQFPVVNGNDLSVPVSNASASISSLLTSRQLPQGQCSGAQECWDKSCCSKSGWCGRDPDYCSVPGNCVSNCGAKAECGRGAEIPGTQCPLNVCCGPFGYCGTTAEFCTTTGDKVCQSDCTQPPSTGQSGGDIRSLVIGYLGAWSITRRGCAQRDVADIPVGSLTHLNIAFAYIKPGTFEVYPMRAWAEDWIALGGWTFSDNETDTQPVWGDLSSTPAKRKTFIGQLMKFMDFWGLDGVDLDWEYPGAPDRGGNKNDGQNFVYLLEDIKIAFASRPGWGLSFTAPTSYWYEDPSLSHAGSVNDPGADQALNLMWRNNVPANKINLGIGFYGRSYTLSDPRCAIPGCAFSRTGRAGSCTGEGGVLSFAEIESMKKIYGFKPIFDEKTAVKYFAFNEDQWVSYDDAETLQLKVDYAQKQGLLGLFVWSVDLDTKSHDALKALSGGQLNKFAKQNGVQNITDDWQSVSGTQCVWSECGSLDCPGGSIWEVGNFPAGSGICLGSCGNGRIPVITSTYPMMKEPGKDVATVNACLISGKALYCCSERLSGTSPCTYYPDTCIGINKNGQPTTGTGCPNAGQKLVTYARGKCSPRKGEWSPFCCESDVVTDQCRWTKGNVALWCEGAGKCNGAGEVSVIQDVDNGAGYQCRYTRASGSSMTAAPWVDADLAYCCPADAMLRGTISLPVPLANLFPDPGLPSDVQRLGVEVQNNGNNQRPNDNAFGFFILSGPKGEMSTMNKRDGSHWEFFNCPKEMTEDRQTVQVVCTVDGPESNCNDIYEDGVPYTVVEMPNGCGPGKYAMAVSLEPSVNHTTLPHRLVKRLGSKRKIFDFTFDYDFTAVNKRAASSVLLRIDYSDDPGYWDKVVAPPGDPKLRRRQLQEVHEQHGGSYKRWIEHTWYKEKRSMEPHELHERWFSGEVLRWFQLQQEIALKSTTLNRRLDEDIRWKLFDQQIPCKPFGVDEMYFRSYADLMIHAEASTGFTAIGTLSNLRSFDQSHVWFRSKGRVDASLVFEAFAKLSFHTGQVELFGAQNFGSPFRVPGLVTIGPNFKVLASISGDATFKFDSVNPPGEPGFTRPALHPLEWDFNAQGEIRVNVIPQVTLGIAFDSDKVANAEVILGVDNTARIYGNMKYGSGQEFQVCYGSDASVMLYAELKAPTLFKINISGRKALKMWGPFPVYPFTCVGGNQKIRRDGVNWNDVELPVLGSY